MLESNSVKNTTSCHDVENNFSIRYSHSGGTSTIVTNHSSFERNIKGTNIWTTSGVKICTWPNRDILENTKLGRIQNGLKINPSNSFSSVVGRVENITDTLRVGICSFPSKVIAD